jgi:hypothetical protein
MKLKLGIFGDSYGCSGMIDNDIPEKAWPEIIADTFIYEMENFSLGGSDLFFSYKKFIDNHNRFDKIIFLITSPNRIYIPNLNTFTNASQVFAKENLAKNQDKPYFKAVIDYYKYIHDEEKEMVFFELLLNNIASVRPDAILYPCFDLPFLKDFSLSKITEFEDSVMGMNADILQQFYFKGLRDSRKCHMTGANNKLVAEMFMKRLVGEELNIDESKIVAPEHDVSYYHQSKFMIVSGKY